MSITGRQLKDQALKHLGMPYVYGMKGQVLTNRYFRYLQATYGKAYVWESDRRKIGQKCCDCSGLIYLCIKELGGGNYPFSSSQLYEKSKRFSIKEIEKAPLGACLWLPGHVGIYLGNRMYVAADGSAYNCRKAPMTFQNWTHFLLLPYVAYDQVHIAPTASVVDQEQLAKAVSKLIRSGVQIDYNSWKREELMNLKYAETLVIKMTNGAFKTGYTSYEACVRYLIEKSIITSSSAWLERSALKKTAFVAILIIKVAAAL